jgi:hypothetical protein
MLAVLLAGTAGCYLPRTAIQAISGSTPLSPATSAPVPLTEAPPTETPLAPTDTPLPIVHTLIPGNPAGPLSQITDTDTSAVASQHRASGGENYNHNLFERPFDQSMNTYLPDLDIKNTSLSRDDTWVYVTTALNGPNPKGGLLGTYGVELDVNQDGRGDYLVVAAAPGADWSTDGVRVWQDADHDVGGSHPVQADAPPQAGTSFENPLVAEGRGTDADLAWGRVSPQSPTSVQIAFKRSMFQDASRFLWGAWAVDPAMFHQDWFDYDDHFSQVEAGSPLTELTQYYPLKALYAVDNTCRWAVGFTPTGHEPGICPIPPTPTPIPPGNISGLVFYDWDVNDGYDNPPDYPLASASVRVRSGACSSPGGVVGTTSTNSTGLYSILVAAGKYCVDVHPDPGIGYNQKSSPVTVTVPAGGSAHADFWYREQLY